MGYEPSGSFITSMLGLKLDLGTMFEWQQHSQCYIDVPHFKKRLEFVNLLTQASEATIIDVQKRASFTIGKEGCCSGKPVASFAANADTSLDNCVACKTDKHPLFVCS